MLIGTKRVEVNASRYCQILLSQLEAVFLRKLYGRNSLLFFRLINSMNTEKGIPAACNHQESSCYFETPDLRYRNTTNRNLQSAFADQKSIDGTGIAPGVPVQQTCRPRL